MSTQSPQTNDAFVAMEQKWLAHWYENGIVDRYLTRNDHSNERFSFLDGPITANNPMGVHHAWGRTYKDLFQRFHTLLGKKQHYQNGFDCQGLWVEVEVEKELGLTCKKDIENLIPGDTTASIAKFVQLCKERVQRFAGLQTEQSKRLGYFMDWENSYYTMSEENNYMIWHFLKTCFENGWMYRGHDSVPWCPRCGTAISQHEILTEDYAQLQHESVYFLLPLTEHALPDLDREVSMLAWTTTPWTVPGNVALAVNPEITYSVVKLNDSGRQIILAESRIKDTLKEDHTVMTTVPGTALIGARYVGPFDHLERAQHAAEDQPKTFHTVVDGTDLVSEEEGTGVLHVAPGQGQEDYTLGKKVGLPVIELIEEDASYYDQLGPLTGQNAKERPGIIFSHLKEHEEGRFFYKTRSYNHRYPRCWRCKTELVWRVVDEWYIAMDKPSARGNDKRTLRERMIAVAKQINWIPGFGLDRELNWLENMHDWLISKKRYWGLALPIWVSEDGQEFEVIGSREELKERAVEGWDTFDGNTPHRPHIDQVVITSKKTGAKMYRIPDVGNPWLDAGIVPFSTLTDPKTGKPYYLDNPSEFQNWFPVDFITESFPGQFKNWFYAMIAMATVLEDHHPYKTVLGFGTLLAEDGRAMHKSWGNSIEFNEGANSIGVDVMRWMYIRQNPADNMLFGPRKANEVRRQVTLMIWNVFKFLNEYAALDKVTLTTLAHTRPTHPPAGLDQWILARLNQTTETARASLEAYDPRGYATAIEQLIDDLSTWYLRRSRNRVWLQAQSDEDRQSFYHTLTWVLTQLSVLLAPAMPFMSEEIYTRLTNADSVHLADWPDLQATEGDHNMIADMRLVREIVEIAHRHRKDQKLKVRQPLPGMEVFLPESTVGFRDGALIHDYTELMKEELNIKEITYTSYDKQEPTVVLNTELTDELIHEGALRELIRSIQAERKKLGVTHEQAVDLLIPAAFKDDTSQIQAAVRVRTIRHGEALQVSLV